MELRYLFEAVFEDGTVIHQTPQDISIVDPTRSAYYDVEQKGSPIVFGLYNDDHSYVVDLRDGHFEIDGVPFSAQPVSAPIIIDGGEFKLLYFRDHQHDIGLSGFGEWEEKTHTHQYRMGWNYTDPNGKTYTQTIVIV